MSFDIVSWFSLNFCTETSSTRSSWTLFICPISCVLRIWVSRSTCSFIDQFFLSSRMFSSRFYISVMGVLQFQSLSIKLFAKGHWYSCNTNIGRGRWTSHDNLMGSLIWRLHHWSSRSWREAQRKRWTSLWTQFSSGKSDTFAHERLDEAHADWDLARRRHGQSMHDWKCAPGKDTIGVGGPALRLSKPGISCF